MLYRLLIEPQYSYPNIVSDLLAYSDNILHKYDKFIWFGRNRPLILSPYYYYYYGTSLGKFIYQIRERNLKEVNIQKMIDFLSFSKLKDNNNKIWKHAYIRYIKFMG